MAENKSKLNPIIAIEIGNVNSGYVFFSGDEEHQILTASYGSGLNEDRIPTALLLNSDSSLNSFGTLAKETYFILTLKKKTDGYVYFENRLQTSIESSGLQESIHGKQRLITKVDIYAHIIEYLYDICLESLNERDFKEEDILVIFPADKAKMQIMRSAVEKTKIKNVRVVSEMDAAALYCSDQNVLVKNDAKVNKLGEGSKFVVLDLGGEKAQYCKYEVLGEDRFRRIGEEVVESSGGETITENFIKALESIVGEKKWKKFTIENKADYLRIRQSFEIHKLSFESSKPDIIMEMPTAFVTLVDGNIFHGISIEKENKIIVKRELLEDLFDKSIQVIIEKLKDDIEYIDIISLVGGFSNSPYVLNYIKDKIKHIPVVLVHKPGLAMLKGAVTMGHKQMNTSEHVYGFVSMEKFSEEQKVENDVFIKVIHMNEMVGPGQLRKLQLSTRDKGKNELVLWKTKETNVLHINENSKERLEAVSTKSLYGGDEVIVSLRANMCKNKFTLETGEIKEEADEENKTKSVMQKLCDRITGSVS